LVGLAINLVSAYAKSPLDRFFASLSHAWSERSNKSRAAMAERLKLLRVDPEARQALWESELRARLRSVAFVVLAVLFMLFYLSVRVRYSGSALDQVPAKHFWLAAITYWTSAATLVFGATSHLAAAQARYMLHRAREDSEA
jgi:hypothetical protein